MHSYLPVLCTFLADGLKLHWAVPVVQQLRADPFCVGYCSTCKVLHHGMSVKCQNCIFKGVRMVGTSNKAIDLDWYPRYKVASSLLSAQVLPL